MQLIDLLTAKAHLRVSGTTEDAAIALYVTAAETKAAHYVNRALFRDQASLEAAQAGLTASLDAAVQAHDAATAAAAAMDDGPLKDAAIRSADDALAAVVATNNRIQRGMVADDAVRVAVLLITGHLYENRSEAAEIPAGAKTFLDTVRSYG